MPIRHVILSNSNYEQAIDVVRRELSLSIYSELGSGCFATVYQHPLYQDKVIKVLRFRDPGYTTFVRAVLRLQDKGKPCPWLPRIYEATMFHVRNTFESYHIRDSATVLVVVLDKLIGDAVDNSRLTDEQRHIIEGLRDARIWDIQSGTLVERFGNLAPCKQLKRQLRRAEHAIRWAMNKVGATCDLHWGNIMFKPDSGQLVITDPLS